MFKVYEFKKDLSCLRFKNEAKLNKKSNGNNQASKQKQPGSTAEDENIAKALSGLQIVENLIEDVNAQCKSQCVDENKAENNADEIELTELPKAASIPDESNPTLQSTNLSERGLSDDSEKVDSDVIVVSPREVREMDVINSGILKPL